MNFKGYRPTRTERRRMKATAENNMPTHFWEMKSRWGLVELREPKSKCQQTEARRCTLLLLGSLQN
jgi:hypothetical protein